MSVDEKKEQFYSEHPEKVKEEVLELLRKGRKALLSVHNYGAYGLPVHYVAQLDTLEDGVLDLIKRIKNWHK